MSKRIDTYTKQDPVDGDAVLGITAANLTRLFNITDAANLPYEVGTWTPVYSPTTGAFTTLTYNFQVGHFTRIGNRYIVTGRISTNDVDVGTASGNLNIGGLPAIAENISGLWYSAAISFVALWATDMPSMKASVAAGGDIIQLEKNATNVTLGRCEVSDLTAGANAGYNRIAFMAVYQV